MHISLLTINISFMSLRERPRSTWSSWLMCITPPTHTLPRPLPITPLSSSPHGSTNVGRGLSGLHQSGPALYVRLCSSPMRSRVVLRALEFPAGGGCSVWFIPVYSCLLCVAGDLTARTPTVARVHAHTQIHARAHIHTHTHYTGVRAQAVYDSSPDTELTGRQRCGLKRTSAEVAGSLSSAGSTRDTERVFEIQTITEEMRKCLVVMVFLLRVCSFNSDLLRPLFDGYCGVLVPQAIVIIRLMLHWSSLWLFYVCQRWR